MGLTLGLGLLVFVHVAKLIMANVIAAHVLVFPH